MPDDLKRNLSKKLSYFLKCEGKMAGNILPITLGFLCVFLGQEAVKAINTKTE